jgi:uncharacterized membrane protein YcaP (DUF421 family)
MGTVLHAIVGYLFLLLVLRVLGRRPGAQMTASEFVLVFLMGGIVILATMGNDRSVTNTFCAVITVCAIHRLVAYLKSISPRVGAVVDGPPLVLLKDGQWQTDTMNQMMLKDDDVMAAARSKGVKTFKEVKYAILERNGGISIIKSKSGNSE